ncbi:hypothetical protein M5C97_23950 [Acidovorax sp. NCPPB 3859]|nr:MULTISPECIES: hypothetical protein [unclassified Acidovorax]MDA8453080.1 hypothetical protein [Acidovorax sp. GBBC 3297]MDA8462482.1 hypothetical protein [Acidovorax sp. GBBC 3333]MDA8467516.1 hypothetical protein [Acidovorax sp. GBBC 3332]MDA8472556.1 hypothetical protein [Acidovorax sp. GBBC 3299]WCM78499.1 hypothetical protein M5C94_23900 [Acidovorax sp. GBBC 712]
MQFRIFPAFLVFLGSYFPLALILALQDVSPQTWNSSFCKEWKGCDFPKFEHPWLSGFGMLMTGLCLALTFNVISKIRYKYRINILESKSIPSELISYSFPYIVSFMGVDYSSSGKIAGLVAFLIWLFLITYKAGQIIMNPILLIFGWNLYEAKILINKHERIVKILSRNILPPGNYDCANVQGSYITKGEPCDA